MIGEMIIYDADDNHNYERFKIGDGVRNVNELPFSEADWNAAEGEPGHILNKPTFIDEKVLLDLSIAKSYNDDTFGKAWVINKAPHLTLGEIYTINYNGIDYNCECVTVPSGLIKDSNAVALGNSSVIGGANTGEPFAMVISEVYNRIDILDLVNSESVNVKISKTDQYLDPKYIPDMYYTEGSGKVELPVSGEWSEIDPGAWMYMISAPIGLEVGKTYIVNWNGVDYTVIGKKLVAPDGSGMEYVGIGNTALTGGEDTGEPFGIMETTAEYAEQFGGIASIDMSGNIPFTIYANGEVVHKLPVKYLPEGLPYSEITNGGFIDTLTFDGDINSKPSINSGDGIYITHISDTFVDSAKLIGGEITLVGLAGDAPNGTFTITEDMIQDASEMYGFHAYILYDAVIVVSQDLTMEGITLPKGISFMCVPNMFYVSELKATDAVFYSDGEIVHKLAGKYLPTGTPYIENEGVTEVVLPETTVTGLNSDGAQINLPFGLKPLTRYVVTWNGTKYTVTSSENIVGVGFSFIALGRIMGLSSDAPFGILNGINNGSKIQIVAPHDGSTEAAISIAEDKTIIQKIDERVLPDDIVRNADFTVVKEKIDEKMDKANPVGTGSFSMNRKAGTTVGGCSHAEGYSTTASGQMSHAEGCNTTASGYCSHAEGYYTTASEQYSHAEGYYTTASEQYSHAEGKSTTASGQMSHAEGGSTIASGYYSHAEGSDTEASGSYSHSEGVHTTASGNYSHAEGHSSTALGDSSHAEGSSTASGNYSHSEGALTTASGLYSHAEGYGSTLPDTITSNSTKQDIINIWEANADKFLLAFGQSSHAEGDGTLAIGHTSHAEGYRSIASGVDSHAEGSGTRASGQMSHAEGSDTIASGTWSHAEGSDTEASGYYSHAEGWRTKASGECQHVQGKFNIEDANQAFIIGNGLGVNDYSNAHTVDWKGNAWFAGEVYVGSTSGTNKDNGSEKLVKTSELNKKPGLNVEGKSFTIDGEIVTAGAGAEVFNNYNINIASGNGSHAEGFYTIASGYGSHAEGNSATASGSISHAEGSKTTASGDYSHAEGVETTASGYYSHAEGIKTTASGSSSHAEGYCTTASGSSSHAEGQSTIASGQCSHAEGASTTASGYYSHAEGYSTTASGRYSHAEGGGSKLPESITKESSNDDIITAWNNLAADQKFTLAKGNYSHAEGERVLSIGYGSHAEGSSTTASGSSSHAEGQSTIASGQCSHAEGSSTTASGSYSHAEGFYTIASGYCSHAEGNRTTASGSNQHVQGIYNIEDGTSEPFNKIGYAHILGNGTDSTKSNAHTVDWYGNAWYAGDVYVGSTSGTNKDSGSRKLVAAPNDMSAGDLLMYNGNDFVKLSKAELIAEIIAALPRAEEASF